MAAMQTERPIEIHTPLGDDVLLFRHMRATEELGRLSEFRLELLSEQNDIKFEDLLGQNVTIVLDLPDDEKRYFNGFVSEFAQVGRSGEYARYDMTLRPWLWFLTRTSDCRIFQEMTIPDILKEVFRGHDFTDFEEALSGEYDPLTYCVQYRETDFNFVSRLMEQEGIYYFFKHEDGKHTLVLADSSSAHETVSGYEEVPFMQKDAEGFDDQDHLHEWRISHKVQPGAVALNAFDFEKPRAGLEVRSTAAREHAQAEFEMYDYEDAYVETGAGDRYARTRIEELQARYERIDAAGNARGLFAGALFSTSDHPREDQNREYLVVGAIHELTSSIFESGAGQDQDHTYSNRLTLIDSQQPFRPQRSTRKPVVEGPQTAVIVGQEGEEVWTDEYGRVKVRFHWDRYASGDETSSCWVRVSQSWGGKRWGSMFMPHVGQEVIIDFLEGDPDRPIITGRVYNADNMPPLTLPENRYRSGFWDNFGNELMFDAGPGKEFLRLHSPSHTSMLELGKSTSSWTESDGHKYTVGNSISTTVGSTSNFFCGNKFYLTGGAAESVTIGASASVLVGLGISINVGPRYNFTLGGSINHAYSYSYTRQKSVEVNHNSAKYKRASQADIIHDSEQAYRAVGGDRDNSFLVLDKERAVLSYGKGPPDTSTAIRGSTMAWNFLWGTVAALGAAGIAVTAGANDARDRAQEQVARDTAGFTDTGDNPPTWHKWNLDWTAWDEVATVGAYGVAGTVATLAALGYGMTLKKIVGAVALKEHAHAESTRVEANEKKVLLQANNPPGWYPVDVFPGPSPKEVASVEVGTNGAINIKSEGKIKIESKKADVSIRWPSNKNFKMRGFKLNIQSMINHKNFKVKK